MWRESRAELGSEQSRLVSLTLLRWAVPCSFLSEVFFFFASEHTEIKRHSSRWDKWFHTYQLCAVEHQQPAVVVPVDVSSRQKGLASLYGWLFLPSPPGWGTACFIPVVDHIDAFNNDNNRQAHLCAGHYNKAFHQWYVTCSERHT